MCKIDYSNDTHHLHPTITTIAPTITIITMFLTWFILYYSSNANYFELSSDSDPTYSSSPNLAPDSIRADPPTENMLCTVLLSLLSFHHSAD